MLALWKKIHDQPAAAAKSLHSCPTLCDPKDGSPSGFPIPGIIQERTGVGCHFLLQCMKVKSESEVTSSFMTKLDSILKSRDITLPTKVHLVRAMTFPVVMYGCESWTIKKAECRRIDAFELWCWRRFLRVPWTARRSN